MEKSLDEGGTKGFELDTTFGDGGRVIGDAKLLDGISANTFYSIALRRDRSMVLVSSDKDRNAGLLVALKPDGTLNSALAGKGYVQVQFKGFVFEDGVAVQELGDDRLFFTAWLQGEYGALWVPGFAVLHADGSLDETFGEQGITVVQFEDLRSPRPRAKFTGQRTPSSMVFVSGTHFIIPFVVNDEQTMIIRLLANGKLDTDYHGRGYQLITFGGQDCELAAVTVLDNGNLLLAGRYEGQENALLVALTADGEIDTDFGSEGFVTVDGSEGARLLSVLENSAQALLFSGFLGSQGLVAKSSAAGVLDTAFGEEGKVLLPSVGGRTRLECLDSRLDQLICGAGQEHLSLTDSIGVLTCHNPTGIPHEAFGQHGRVTVENSHGFWALKVQSDGKWLVAGAERSSRVGSVRRYTAPGLGSKG